LVLFAHHHVWDKAYRASGLIGACLCMGRHLAAAVQAIYMGDLSYACHACSCKHHFACHFAMPLHCIPEFLQFPLHPDLPHLR
jgi:hypothetical protein